MAYLYFEVVAGPSAVSVGCRLVSRWMNSKVCVCDRILRLFLFGHSMDLWNRPFLLDSGIVQMVFFQLS